MVACVGQFHCRLRPCSAGPPHGYGWPDDGFADFRHAGEIKTARSFALVCLLVAVGTPALVWPAAGAVVGLALIFGASFIAGLPP